MTGPNGLTAEVTGLEKNTYVTSGTVSNDGKEIDDDT